MACVDREELAPPQYYKGMDKTIPPLLQLEHQRRMPARPEQYEPYERSRVVGGHVLMCRHGRRMTFPAAFHT